MTNTNKETFVFAHNDAPTSRNWKMANFTIEDVFNTIQADEANKRDIIIHPANINVSEETGLIEFNRLLEGTETFGLNSWSKSQWCGKMNGLTPKYWDECPAWLKAANGNHWLKEMVKDLEKKAANRKTEPNFATKGNGELLFRVREGGVDTEGNELGNTIRGIMSDKYAKFDDIKLVEMLMTILEDKELQFQDMKIAKYHRDDLGFHIRLLTNEAIEIGEEVKGYTKSDRGRKDMHFRGIMIENSEVGRKSIRIKPFIWRQVCSNGLIAYNFDADTVAFKQRHIGITEEEIRDNVATAMGQALDATAAMIERLKKAKSSEVMEAKKAFDLIERFSKESKYDKKFTALVHEQYAKEKKNAFGIVQAFTEAVQNFKPYTNIDDRTRVEMDAAKLLERLTA